MTLLFILVNNPSVNYHCHCLSQSSSQFKVNFKHCVPCQTQTLSKPITSSELPNIYQAQSAMTTTFIVISSDEEDAVEKPANCIKPRRKPSHYSEKPKPVTAHYQPTYSTGCKNSTPSSSVPIPQTQTPAPRSKTADIPSVSNRDHGKIIPRSVSAPRPDFIPLRQVTRSVESQFKNQKQTAAPVARRQDTPDVLITGQVTRRTGLLQPGPNPQRIDAGLSDQSVHPTRSIESLPNRETPGETQHSHTCKANGSALFNATTTTTTTVDISSSQQQPLPNDLSRAASAGKKDDAFGASPNDADMSPQPAEPAVMEYPWPPPSMNMASAPNPYYNHDSGLEQQEEIQGPYFLATAHHHSRQDILPSAKQVVHPPTRYPLTQPQREPSSQTSPKRKDQSSPIERAAAPKRARIIYPPVPTTIPNHQPPFTSPHPSPPSPTTTRRPRSRPWTSAMIADMAQTLQCSFPFADFSAKHGKAPTEVFEAFSAVVQMPLFEYSAKGMARARMKGFQDRIRDYRDKGRDIQRMHRREERRREKGLGKAGAGVGGGEKEGAVVVGEEEGGGGGVAETRKPALAPGAAGMRGSGSNHEKKKTTMPTIIQSALESAYIPTTTASANAITTIRAPAPAPAPAPARTPAPAPTPTSTPPKHKTQAIAPAAHSNRAPVLELRDGIYMVAE